MLPKKSRIHLGHFPKQAEETRSFPLFALKAVTNQQGRNRFGIVVGRRTLKSAAKRHMWIRKLESACEGLSRGSSDIVVLLSSRATGENPEAVRNAVRRALEDTLGERSRKSKKA